MIDNIRLQNFRSYGDDTFEFGAGVNIIVGPNASGKTNLLESILAEVGGLQLLFRVPPLRKPVTPQLPARSRHLEMPLTT